MEPKRYKCYACHGTGIISIPSGRYYRGGRQIYEWKKCFHCTGTGIWTPTPKPTEKKEEQK